MTHALVECRGKKEDNELALEFRRKCDGENAGGLPYRSILFCRQEGEFCWLATRRSFSAPNGNVCVATNA